MWPGNCLGTARADFAAGCRTCTGAVDDVDFVSPGIAATTCI
jgi:hypothetical protein